MQELVKKGEQGLVPQGFSKEAAKQILDIFPFARFSSAISSLLDETRDERFTQNFLCSFQLSHLRNVYMLLQDVIPGLELAFPILINSEAKENESSLNEFTILWMVDSDPYSLGDSISVHARTVWKSVPPDSLNVNIAVHTPFGNCCEYKEAARSIMRSVPPILFDEVFMNFFRAIRIRTCCPKIEKRKNELPVHPSNCIFCNNEDEVLLHKIFGSKFKPSAWLEMITSFEGWNELWQKK